MAFNPARLLLKQGRTALMICDIQEKFSKVTYEFDKMVLNTTKLVNACKLLDVPVIITEQNPKSLGSTVPELVIPGSKGPFAKMLFSMCTPEVDEALSTICSGGPPEAVLLVGTEAHICVETTALDLKKRGYEVHAVHECITSRTKEDRLLAFDRMRDFGCVIASTENVIFKLLVDANHKQFRDVLALLRKPTAHL